MARKQGPTGRETSIWIVKKGKVPKTAGKCKKATLLAAKIMKLKNGPKTKQQIELSYSDPNKSNKTKNRR